MGTLSELPVVGRTLPSVSFAELAQSAAPQYIEDEEFPPDLPGTYDWMLQPASQRRWRRAMKFLAVAAAAASIAVASFFVYHRPGFMVLVGAALAGGIFFVIPVKALSYLLKARLASQQFSPRLKPSARIGAHLPRG